MKLEEATTEGEDGWLIPEQRTLPGWTGANIIPIRAISNEVTVEFDPGEEADMVCQLCWRTEGGKPVYADPFQEGSCTVSLREGLPANGVIFAVVCNRTYKIRQPCSRSTSPIDSTSVKVPAVPPPSRPNGSITIRNCNEKKTGMVGFSFSRKVAKKLQFRRVLTPV